MEQELCRPNGLLLPLKARQSAVAISVELWLSWSAYCEVRGSMPTGVLKLLLWAHQSTCSCPGFGMDVGLLEALHLPLCPDQIILWWSSCEAEVGDPH